MALEGLHHITAITADAPRNVDFYARVLGLRLVKKTVNFDQPDVYHLYFGDERGDARLDPDLLRVPRRRPAARPATAWSTPSSGASRPTRRSTSGPPAWPTPTSPPSAPRTARWRFADFEGLRHELLAVAVDDAPLAAHAPDIPAEHALLGFHGVRAYASRPDASTALLEAIGFAHDGGADWTLRGDERHAALRYDAPPAGPRRDQRRDRPPRRVVGRRRRRARGRPRAGRRGRRPRDRDHRPPVLPLRLLPRAQRRPLRARQPRHRLRVRRAAGDPRRGAQAAAAVRGAPRAARAGADAADQPARRGRPHDRARPRDPPGGGRAARARSCSCTGAAPTSTTSLPSSTSSTPSAGSSASRPAGRSSCRRAAATGTSCRASATPTPTPSAPPTSSCSATSRSSPACRGSARSSAASRRARSWPTPSGSAPGARRRRGSWP